MVLISAIYLLEYAFVRGQGGTRVCTADSGSRMMQHNVSRHPRKVLFDDRLSQLGVYYPISLSEYQQTELHVLRV